MGSGFCLGHGIYKRGYIFEMLDTILKIAGMIVSAIGTIVKVIELVDRFRHQKSNRTDQS